MNKIFALSAALFSAAIITACSKDDDNTSATAQLMVVNASPNSSAVEVSANGKVLVPTLAYPGNTGYQVVSAGTNNIKVGPAGTTTYYINTNMDLQAGSSYTVYLVDSATKAKGTTTKDDTTRPAAGKAKVRFLHLSPNLPAIDVKFTGSGTSSATFSGRNFNDVSATTSYATFIEVDAGTYQPGVTAAGTSTVITGIVLQPLQFDSGKIYTVFAKGFLTGTGSVALGLQKVVHN